MNTVVDMQAVPAAQARGYWKTVFARLLRDRVTVACAIVILLLILMAIFAPWLAPEDPLKSSIFKRLKPIGTEGYPLGTDELGRDMLSRLIFGARLSLVMGITPVLAALAIGSLLGITAGFIGGRVNTAIMRTIDVFYAFPSVLLAVAIWIVSPALPPAGVMLAWAALAIGCAMFLRALDSLPQGAHPAALLAKGLGIMALVAGVALVVGALAGSRDPLRPLAGLMGDAAPAAAPKFERIASSAELDARLAAAGRPVMLDFYADWCVSCKEMEHYTFSDPRVKAKLEGTLLLQADVTANNAEHKQLLKRFSLFGPPGIIFFDAQGREIKGLRVIGYQNAERFLKTLDLASAR